MQCEIKLKNREKIWCNTCKAPCIRNKQYYCNKYKVYLYYNNGWYNNKGDNNE